MLTGSADEMNISAAEDADEDGEEE
jgi:hypothetical protein